MKNLKEQEAIGKFLQPYFASLNTSIMNNKGIMTTIGARNYALQERQQKIFMQPTQ